MASRITTVAKLRRFDRLAHRGEPVGITVENVARSWFYHARRSAVYELTVRTAKGNEVFVLEPGYTTVEIMESDNVKA